jgi:hypothetical protein
VNCIPNAVLGELHSESIGNAACSCQSLAIGRDAQVAAATAVASDVPVATHEQHMVVATAFDCWQSFAAFSTDSLHYVPRKGSAQCRVGAAAL